MGKEGAQRFVQFFINRNKAKKILNIDLDVISPGEKVKVVCNILIWIGHEKNLLSFIFCTHYTVIVQNNPESRHNYYGKQR